MRSAFLLHEEVLYSTLNLLMTLCICHLLSHRFSCVLITSSIAPEGHSSLCQQCPDKRTICSAACMRCSFAPYNWGFVCLNLICFWGAVLCPVPPPPPPTSFPEGHGLCFTVCWSAQCCHKHKCDQPLYQTVSEQFVCG